MNLAIRSLNGDLGKYAADTFTEDLHKDLKADFILATNDKEIETDGQYLLSTKEFCTIKNLRYGVYKSIKLIVMSLYRIKRNKAYTSPVKLVFVVASLSDYHSDRSTLKSECLSETVFKISLI